MNNIDLNSKQWCELVFEGKNHDFGAYEMRRDSAARHNKAMLIVTILAIVVILLPSIIRFVAPKKEAEEKMTEVTTLSLKNSQTLPLASKASILPPSK